MYYISTVFSLTVASSVSETPEPDAKEREQELNPEDKIEASKKKPKGKTGTVPLLW